MSQNDEYEEDLVEIDPPIIALGQASII
jgi:hypothetical protein